MAFARCTRRAVFFLSLILLTAIAQKAVADPLVLEVAQADVDTSPRLSGPAINITLTETSAKTFGDFTRDNINRTIEIRVKGKVIMEPVIKEPILGGVITLVGWFEDAKEARDFADQLKGDQVEVALSAK